MSGSRAKVGQTRPRGLRIALVVAAIAIVAAIVTVLLFGGSLFGGRGTDPTVPSESASRDVSAVSGDSPTGRGRAMRIKGEVVSLDVVSPGKVLVSTRQALMMLDLNQGKLVWHADGRGLAVNTTYEGKPRERATFLEYGDGVIRSRLVSTGEVVSEGSMGQGAAVHCGEEVTVIEADNTVTYAATDLSNPLRRSAEGATWPADEPPDCFSYDPDWAFGVQYPTFQMLLHKSDNSAEAAAGAVGAQLDAYFFEDSVYIGSHNKEATLAIRGVTEAVTDHPEFVFLMGEDGISAVKRDTLEMYWTDVGGNDVLKGIRYVDGVLVGISEDLVFKVDIETGYPTPLAQTSPSAMWFQDWGSMMCSADGGERAGRTYASQDGNGMRITCIDAAGRLVWAHAVKGAARMVVHNAAMALMSGGESTVFV